jgi:hypothetical protein
MIMTERNYEENDMYKINKTLEYMCCELPVLQLNLEAESKRYGIPIENLRKAFRKTIELHDNCIALYPKTVSIYSNDKIGMIDLIGDIYPSCKFVENMHYRNKLDSIETQGPVFSVYSKDKSINDKIEKGIAKLSGFWIGTKTNLRLARIFLVEEN